MRFAGVRVSISTGPATSGARPRHASSALNHCDEAVQSASMNASRSAREVLTPAFLARERLGTGSDTTRAPSEAAISPLPSRDALSTTMTS